MLAGLRNFSSSLASWARLTIVNFALLVSLQV